MYHGSFDGGSQSGFSDKLLHKILFRSNYTSLNDHAIWAHFRTEEFFSMIPDIVVIQLQKWVFIFIWNEAHSFLYASPLLSGGERTNTNINVFRLLLIIALLAQILIGREFVGWLILSYGFSHKALPLGLVGSIAIYYRSWRTKWCCFLLIHYFIFSNLFIYIFNYTNIKIHHFHY